MNYTYEEIEKQLGYEFEKKRTECDALQISKLRKLLEDGWIIYDTQPAINSKNVMILTLVKE